MKLMENAEKREELLFLRDTPYTWGDAQENGGGLEVTRGSLELKKLALCDTRGEDARETTNPPRNTSLQSGQKDVYYVVEDGTRHRNDIIVAELDASLRERHGELLDELLRRAILQNPDLAAEIKRVEASQDAVRSARVKERIEAYESWKNEQLEARRRERKIRYDDKRNRNALTGIRRSIAYKTAPRMEKIQMELDDYYAKYGIEPPDELMKELAKLKHAKELYLKRIKRDEYGRIVRPRMAG